MTNPILASLEEWAKAAMKMSYDEFAKQLDIGAAASASESTEDLRRRLLAAYKRTPFAVGFDHAQTVGAQLEDNPHEAQTPDYAQWATGYAAGFKVS